MKLRKTYTYCVNNNVNIVNIFVDALVHSKKMRGRMLPAGLLVKVVPNPSEGLDSHQTGHVHLLHVVRGGQHDLVGVRLDGRKEAERTRRK